MATRTPSKPALAASLARIGNQFKGLNTNDPASWPLAPQMALFASVVTAIVVALWFVLISTEVDALNGERAREDSLKQDYSRKLSQAVNLDALRKQREQVLLYVNQLEKQLPGKAEMDALLSDINQAGLGRSLYFDLFRPGQVNVKEYYAELPISIKVVGRYHDVGAFASDIANLSRIVTLNNIVLTPGRDGNLTMESTAKTFRYLDAEEVAAQRKAAAGSPRK